jgi:beta-lactamase superfamily II metal-dependent hydrolase
MPINNLDTLRIHVVNVDHGDGIILELPDYNGQAHFGVVDTGRPELVYRDRVTDYLKELIDLRNQPFRIEFLCITHPHEDHYGGLKSLLDCFGDKGIGQYANTIQQFWDSGFRIAGKTYNELLNRICDDNHIVFARLASGAEYEFGDARIIVLAPSLDLRNRFDTYGVDKNNSSIVLQILYKGAKAILAGDAQFDSWGKIAEEFPRATKISYFKDALTERSEGANQLDCQLIKVSHHGSKHGTSLEYLEKLTPKYYMITCADNPWYQLNKPGWGTDWPHPLTSSAINEVTTNPQVHHSYLDKTVVYSLTGGKVANPSFIQDNPGDPNFSNQLLAVL